VNTQQQRISANNWNFFNALWFFSFNQKSDPTLITKLWKNSKSHARIINSDSKRHTTLISLSQIQSTTLTQKVFISTKIPLLLLTPQVTILIWSKSPHIQNVMDALFLSCVLKMIFFFKMQFMKCRKFALVTEFSFHPPLYSRHHFLFALPSYVCIALYMYENLRDNKIFLLWISFQFIYLCVCMCVICKYIAFIT